MQIVKTKFFRRILCPSLFLFSVGLLLFSYRLSGLILLALLVASYLYFLKSHKSNLMRATWVLFLIAIFAPVDITFQNLPGPPKFVPLVMGFPLPETVVRAERGEVLLGGCVVNENEPRWVFVW
jgi:hypothetical protein